MALLGANQSIGEEELFTNSDVRKSKAVVKTSTIELFSVTAAVDIRDFTMNHLITIDLP